MGPDGGVALPVQPLWATDAATSRCLVVRLLQKTRIVQKARKEGNGLLALPAKPFFTAVARYLPFLSTCVPLSQQQVINIMIYTHDCLLTRQDHTWERRFAWNFTAVTGDFYFLFK